MGSEFSNKKAGKIFDATDAAFDGEVYAWLISKFFVTLNTDASVVALG